MIKLLDKYSASVSLILGQAGALAPFPVNFALNTAGVALAVREAMIQRSPISYIGVGLAQLGFIPAEWLAIGLAGMVSRNRAGKEGMGRVTALFFVPLMILWRRIWYVL